MSCLDDPDYTDRLCDKVLANHRAQVADSHNQLWRAIMLAPSISVSEALLRQEPVPRTALDPHWVRRFGL